MCSKSINIFLALFFIFVSTTNNYSYSSESNIYNVAIVGSGPAGLSAAIYAGRAKLNPILIEGPDEGGEPVKAGLIENYPGILSIQGVDLVLTMQEQAKNFDTEIICDNIIKIDFSKKPYILFTKDREIKAHTIIIATGVEHEKTSINGEDKYIGKGLYLCATCDGPLYKNKKIIVIGGSHEALRQIGILKNYTKDILVLNKKDQVEGPGLLLSYLKDNDHIKVINNFEVTDVIGNKEHVTHVKGFNKKTNQEETFEADAVFLGTKWIPVTNLFKSNLELDNKKQIKVHDSVKTSRSGIFAAGDVTSNAYHQLIPACGFGYIAAMEAEKYLKKQKVIQ